METTQQVIRRHSLDFLHMIWWFRMRQIPLHIKPGEWGAGLTFIQLRAQHYTDVTSKSDPIISVLWSHHTTLHATMGLLC